MRTPCVKKIRPTARRIKKIAAGPVADGTRKRRNEFIEYGKEKLSAAPTRWLTLLGPLQKSTGLKTLHHNDRTG